MDRLFKELVQTHTPKANPHVMNGLATVYMPMAEHYVDTVFKSASKSFPQGLTYVGYERCTPNEEFNEVTRAKNNKRTYDFARSDLYLVKFFFKFNDVELPARYMYLPFVGDAGVMYLGGSIYHLSPVMTDKVISPGQNTIFVRLLRDKVNFERCYHSFTVNGISENAQVVWSRIYRKSKEVRKVQVTTRANACVVHYLLAKYGFSETFQRYAGFVPIIGEDEITEEKYPRDQWVICGSTKIKPKTHISDFYEPCKTRLAIPIEKWDQAVRSLVAGFYYVADHFPSRIRPKFVDKESLWKILLGHIIFSGVFSEGKLYTNIVEHFNSLDEYVDTIVIMKLHEIGYDVTNFYDLLMLIVKHFNEWIVASGENSISLHGKTMEVLYYALYDITSAIFRTNFRLNKLATKKQLTPKEIIETMNKHLKPGTIFGLNRGNIAISSVSYSGDNKYPKITSVVAQQQSISGATRSKKTRTVVDSTKRVEASMLEAGSILFLSKSNPTPAVRANMFMNIDLATGTIVPKPEFAPLMEHIRQQLKGLQDDVSLARNSTESVEYFTEGMEEEPDEEDSDSSNF